jgi:hypothetical protein
LAAEPEKQNITTVIAPATSGPQSGRLVVAKQRSTGTIVTGYLELLSK